METGQHGLKRELKLWDLVPMQVVFIVWLGWSGFAAKQGPSQMTLWLLAIIFFYIPLAWVVMSLSRSMPVEGGVYQWIKHGVSPFAGYMAAWNQTVYAVCAFGVAGSLLANGFAYGGGPGSSWMLTSKPFALALTVLTCLTAFIVNVRGLRLAKWWSDAGSLLMVAIFLGMLYLLGKAWLVGSPGVHSPFTWAWPGFSLVTLNVFTKMAVSALSGFEASAVFSEECRKPENDVARSVLIAAPLIALMYIAGTSAVLAYIDPARVDMAAAVPQVMEAGFSATGIGRTVAIIAAVAFNLSFIASMVIVTGMIARLPMVAGWDGLLPAWWSELHPQFRTPYKAIFAVLIAMLAFGILNLLGAGNQEAVQVSAGAGIGSLCIMYMLLFSVILGRFRAGLPHGRWGKLAAMAGFTVAFCALLFEIVPLGDVVSPFFFAMKVAGAICAANGLGAYLYWRGTQRELKIAAASRT